ncbi:LemA family protein [Nemorincola caseinilytica]|uniref:LemA family protein n=1 Tax=Nemorincola caseinilytica TaxID=2054315 RepID=A0ABP8NQJ4_9BACT
MNKGLIIFGVIVAILLMGGCSSYNGMNTAQKEAQQKWADVQSSYQRRADLIPNLVATVKGVANFEQTTLTQVIQARASATAIKIDPKDMTPEKLQQFQQSQGQLSQALGRLMVVSEQYPELKANESFRDLQSQLEGTENRIKVSRDAFNEAVKEYNVKITNFPGVMMAGMFHFKEMTMYQAEAGSEKAPEVKF